MARAELGGHPDQPRQPVAGHPLGREHVPRVDEDRGAEGVRRGQDGRSAGSSRFRSPTCVPICTPANPSWRTHRSSSAIARSGSWSGSVPRPANRSGRAATTSARWSFSSRATTAASAAGLSVAEHDRDGREHLEPDAGPVAVLEAHGRIPAVVLDLAERAAVDDDPRPAGADRLQLRPAAVAEARPQVRPGRRQDVGMQVDPIEGHERLRGSPAWAAA